MKMALWLSLKVLIYRDFLLKYSWIKYYDVWDLLRHTVWEEMCRNRENKIRHELVCDEYILIHSIIVFTSVYAWKFYNKKLIKMISDTTEKWGWGINVKNLKYKEFLFSSSAISKL